VEKASWVSLVLTDRYMLGAVAYFDAQIANLNHNAHSNANMPHQKWNNTMKMFWHFPSNQSSINLALNFRLFVFDLAS
jgi:hypothetical protein